MGITEGSQMTKHKSDQIREKVRERYAGIATSGKSGSGCSTASCCSTKASSSKAKSAKLGYSKKDLDEVPEESNMGLGCGNPQAIAMLKKGEVVLDLGAGGGFDCFLAARQVGPRGRVIGVDMTAEMVAKARACNRCFGIDLNHRFTPAARLARKWMDEGRLGHLLFVNMAMWIKNPNESSPYFHLKALHPHSMDIMRHFCGDVAAVQCFATKAPGRQIWSTAHISLQFRNGVVGSLTGSYDIERGHPMERCEVAGVNGRLVIDDMWREATLYAANDPVKLVYTNPVFGGFRDFTDTFRARLETFLAQVASGCNPEEIDGSGADGLAAKRVLAAAIVSLETGTIVKL